MEELSMETTSLEGDSNALILPAKKKSNKRKNPNQENGRGKKGKAANLIGKTSKLSKSQQRKLRKMEEEKERALMLSQSIEALEKYKIPEDRFALLQSSKSISRAETKKNIRRMAMEVEHVDQPADRTGETPTSESESEAEPETAPEKIYSRQVINKKSHLQPVVVEREVEHQASVSLASHQEPLGTNELGSNDRSLSALSTGEVSKKVNEVLNKEDKKNTSPSLGDHDASKSSELKCESHVSSIRELGKDGNLQDSASQSHPSVPTVVHVLRSEEVEEKRKDLPIVMMEQEIMEAINEHSAVIICGETGCGKTTQVPQFLYEAGFGSNLSAVRSGMIGVTQPRRVAVLATARRVAFELGVHLGKEVGFQVRHDRKIGDDCSIKFMTDGILLREVQNDFLLKRYSVIILDEAHERSVNTDILIGMLSRIIPLRQKKYEEQQRMVLSGQIISPENRILPLKVVLMSATLRVEDFHSSPPPPRRRLFPTTTPVLEVPTRQYPVTVHFSKRTDTVDYIGQAYKKVLLIHKRLPPGGILVFVTGQREVEYLCKKLRNYSRVLMANAAKKDEGNEKTPATDSIAGINIKDINEAFDIEQNSTDMQSNRFSSYDDDADDNGDDVPDFYEDESDVSYGSETESEIEIVGDNDDNLVVDSQQAIELAKLKASFEALAGKTTPELNSEGKQLPFTPKKLSKQQNGETKRDRGFSVSALCVLPLYAMLPAAAQFRVFEEVKEGERLVVVATNVAETSLTIPGIKYVVDTGREKVKTYNPFNGMEAYEVQWISKASAAQRTGRAGRTGPGHCYRLYSSAVFQNLLPDFSPAEISKVPSDSIVLVLKSMFIDKVENFPFPTPPETAALKEAERCLKTLEALDSNGGLTPLGKAMANYPLSPRHSRMLLTVIQIMRKEKHYARANLVLGYALAAAAALSLSNPFLMQFEGSHSDKDGLEQDGDASEKKLDKQEKSRRKKLKQAAKVSRAKFSNPNSDTLTVANTLRGFELSENPVEFCDENALHLKTMEEMSKLRKQLLQLVFNHKPNHEFKQEFSWTHGTAGDVEQAWRFSSSGSPLSLLEEKVLCQAICAGWADRVARRIRGNLSSSEGERKVNAVRYHACMVKDTVFLHRWSSLSKSAPEFLVYSELLHTKRPYMHGATSVESEWLVKYAGSLCSFSSAEESKPYYEPQTDQVFSWVIPTFGPHLWQLPLHGVPISRGADRVKAFAYALLDGQVLPCLKQVRELLAARPSKILEPEGMGERRVGNLLFKLKTRSIDSCTMLREVWEENPTELHSEIKDWFNKSCHEKFEAFWSKMHVEVQMGPDKRFPSRQKREKRKNRDHSMR